MMRRRLLSALLALVMLLSLPLLSACKKEKPEPEKKQKFTEYSLDFFDTATTITGYEVNEETFKNISGEMIALLGEYHKLFTIYHKYSGMENLCTVNEVKDGAHREVTVDARIIDMLLYAKEMYEVTGGKMNVAMGSVLSIWHDYRTVGMDKPWEAELPPMDKLQAAAEHTDINNVIIDKERSTVFLADPEMTLDVGAIAKGYAVEMVAREFETRGVTGYVLNVGGNVRTIGTKPDGESWIAGIENPAGDEEKPFLEYLALSGEALVTSGAYQRFYTVGDRDYHHIIDAATLMPADIYTSVSVVCRDSGRADALSTALFCMQPEEALALVEALDGVEAMLLLKDGTVQKSSGFDRFVTTIE